MSFRFSRVMLEVRYSACLAGRAWIFMRGISCHTPRGGGMSQSPKEGLGCMHNVGYDHDLLENAPPFIVTKCETSCLAATRSGMLNACVSQAVASLLSRRAMAPTSRSARLPKKESQLLFPPGRHDQLEIILIRYETAGRMSRQPRIIVRFPDQILCLAPLHSIPPPVETFARNHDIPPYPFFLGFHCFPAKKTESARAKISCRFLGATFGTSNNCDGHHKGSAK